MSDELVYAAGTTDMEKLRAVAEAEWNNALADEEVCRKLRKAGIDPTVIPATGTFEIRPGSSGFDVSSADVVVAVGSWITGVLGETAREMLLDLWRTQVMPRIADRLGDDAVGSEKD